MCGEGVVNDRKGRDESAAAEGHGERIRPALVDAGATGTRGAVLEVAKDA
jgi:hypothetical protein